ncbi:MAG: hypothetical protein HRT99_02450 [Mycoplasmatales bacterium]|nr:hypothetical protein [Mycoplasmatales bacterium]
MHQYKGILRSTKEVIAEGHSISEIEKAVIHFRREQKREIHTNGNVPIEIYHVKRDQVSGRHKDELIKVV